MRSYSVVPAAALSLECRHPSTKLQLNTHQLGRTDLIKRENVWATRRVVGKTADSPLIYFVFQ